jgi:transketolase
MNGIKSTNMRQTFADFMLEIGRKDPNLVVLIGDISHFILQPFAKACPRRFYNIGICENTIVNMASGLAKVGFYPVVHTISPFLVERSFEQIKIDFGYQKLGVSIITVGSAFDYGGLGCTHHCYDDFALLKNIENMNIFYPASPIEFQVLFKNVYKNGMPNYFRIPARVHGMDIPKNKIKVGKGIVIQTGTDVTIVAVGSQLKTVNEALTILKKEKISAEVIYLSTIKPLDEKLIIQSVTKTKKCLVVEEHGKYGGVFDDVLRVTKDIPQAFYHSINIGDRFIHTYGTYEEICIGLGFTPKNILTHIKKMLKS